MNAATSNDLTTAIRDAVNADYKRLNDDMAISGYVSLDSENVSSHEILDALYPLNHDARFNFLVSYDQRLNLVTWERNEDKAAHRVDVSVIINELESLLTSIKQANDNRRLSYICHGEQGYYIETSDDSINMELALIYSKTMQ